MKRTCLALLAATLAGTAFAQSSPSSFADALAHGKPSINARLRYETAEQNPFQDAEALTLRGLLARIFHKRVEDWAQLPFKLLV